MLRTPIETQQALLRKILSQNSDSAFGRRFNFATIRSIDEYRKKVPISTFSDLEADLFNQKHTGKATLLSEIPIFYALTSGTSSNPKYIPITEEMARDHRHAQSLALLRQIDCVKDIYSYKILAFMSPQEEQRTELGISAGSLSGFLFQRSSKLVTDLYAVPAEVFSINDYEVKQTLIALFAILSTRISVITAVNPSTLLRFEEFLKTSRLKLAQILAAQSLTSLGGLTDTLAAKFNRELVRNSKRVQESICILQSSDGPLIGKLFPEVRAVVTWLGGNCGYYAARIPTLFTQAPKLLEVGYISTEFRGSLAIDPEETASIPTISENFFEFIEVNAWEQGDRNTQLVTELEIGKKYYVIATTKGGLYRYFINDIVEAVRSNYFIAAIKFIQKGSGVSSITGEKLYEEQVCTAVTQLSCLSEAPKILDFIFVADLEGGLYRFYYEGDPVSSSFAQQLDHTISKLNIEYHAKRQSQRLKQIEVQRVHVGTFEFRKKNFIKARGREGQYKAPKLLAHKDEVIDYSRYLAD